MILNSVNSDDKLYIEMQQDYKKHIKGQILRYDIPLLQKRIWSLGAVDILDNELIEFTDNPDIKNIDDIDSFKKNDKIRRYGIVKHDFQLPLALEKNDILLVDGNLKQKLFSKDYCPISTHFTKSDDPLLYRHRIDNWNSSIISQLSDIYEPKSSDEINSKVLNGNLSSILKCNSHNLSYLCIPFYKGEIIDFKSPIIWLIFFKQEFLRLFLSSRVLSDDEKLECFKSDYENWVEEASGKYYKLDERIKIKDINLESLYQIHSIFPDFKTDLCHLSAEYEVDEEGYLRYVLVHDNYFEEKLFSIISTCVSKDLGVKLYQRKKLREMRKQLEYEALLFAQRHKSQFKKMKMKNPSMTCLEFREICMSQEKETKKILVNKMISVLKNKIN